jgi:hypothetical protein
MRIIKKQLNEIAEVIRNYHQAEINGDGYNLAEGMADVLQNYNPLFDYDKFIEACEPIENEVSKVIREQGTEKDKKEYAEFISILNK